MELKQWLGRQEFENEILNSHDPKIVVFAANWCGYCRRFLEIAGSYPTTDGLNVSVVDADSDGESLWDTLRLRLVPTIAVFKDGKEIFRQDGRPGMGLVLGDLDRAIMEASGVRS